MYPPGEGADFYDAVSSDVAEVSLALWARAVWALAAWADGVAGAGGQRLRREVSSIDSPTRTSRPGPISNVQDPPSK